MSEQPQSDRESVLQAETGATWQTVIVKNFSWCRLRHKDLEYIRTEALEFIRLSFRSEQAHAEWFLVFPARQKVTPEVERPRKRDRRKAVPDRFRWEFRATETGHMLLSDRPSGLDSIAELISDRGKRAPRVSR